MAKRQFEVGPGASGSFVPTSGIPFNPVSPGAVTPGVDQNALLGAQQATQLSEGILMQENMRPRGPIQADPLGPQPVTGGGINIGQSLGGVLEGIGQGIEENFSFTFTDQAGIKTRAAELTAQSVTDEFTPGEVAAVQETALAQAQDEAAAGNQKAFNSVVGTRAALEGINIALTHRAVKDQLNNIQRETERAINGIEFNAKLTEQAQNVQAMKNNLRIMDSILQQTGPIRSGRQQQTFARNPISGNLV